MIWIITWDTESGDQGVEGYWKTKPTQDGVDAFIAKKYPADYKAKTIYYSLESLEVVRQ